VADAKGKEADLEGGEAEDGASAKKKLPVKLIAIIGAAALLVLGGGGAAAFVFLKPKPDAHAEKGDKPEKKKKKEEKGHGGKEGEKGGAAQVREGPDGVIFYTLPDIVVNMQTADGRPTFLKLKLTLELPDQATADHLEPNMPRLQDMFQTFLRELRPEDLSGSQGSYQLRMEILRRVNLAIAPSKANAVLIEEMLIN
jgi:flagellar FliL protein